MEFRRDHSYNGYGSSVPTKNIQLYKRIFEKSDVFKCVVSKLFHKDRFHLFIAFSLQSTMLHKFLYLIVRGPAAYFLFNLRENLDLTTYFSLKTFISLVSSSRLDEKSSPLFLFWVFSSKLTSTIKVRKKRVALLNHTYKKKERKKYNSMIFILKRHL